MTYVNKVKERLTLEYNKIIKEVINLIGTPEMNKKINNFVNKVPFASKEEVEQRIREDRLFAAFFNSARSLIKFVLV